MKTLLITGANRGLGLEFCSQYAKLGWQVLACCRNLNQAIELNKLAAEFPLINVHELDVLNRNSVDDLAVQHAGIAIDLLICNAGIYGDKRGQGFGNLDYDEWMNSLETNLLGVVKVAEAFIANLKRAQDPIIAVLSSQMASIEDNGSGGSLLYRSSKAALNATMKSVAIDLQSDNVGVMIFHPGWVKTDMGGPNALINAETSVAGMIQQIEKFEISQTGHFIKYDGKILPW